MKFKPIPHTYTSGIKIRCELCNEDYDVSLMRYYQYTRDMHEEDGSNPDGEIVRYFICEDCVIDHKKNKWKLGEELTNDL